VKISVIIPCLNCERYLAAAIRSVLEQTLAAHEIIVIDDGSVDGSRAVADEFTASGEVKLICQHLRGVSAARNAGIAVASGDFLFFLDADDLIHPRSLEELAAALEKAPGAVGIMGCASFRSTPECPTSITLPGDNTDFFPRIIHDNIGAVHTLLTPAELVRQVDGFRVGMRFFEDWECMARIALLGARLAPVQFAGALYRHHASSTFARAHQPDVVLGHVAVMETLTEGILNRNDLLERHGAVLFWRAWAAIHLARQAGVDWSELRPLASLLQQLAISGPQVVRTSRYAKLIKFLGVPIGEALRNLVLPRGQSRQLVREEF
jgi:glycosyltransferase involved in cell wall biosynthesis